MKRLNVVLVALLALTGCVGDPDPKGEGMTHKSRQEDAKREKRALEKIARGEHPGKDGAAAGVGQEPLKFTGEFEVIAKDKRGRVKVRRHVKNLIVDAGKAGVAGLIIATGHTNAFDHIAIGTGTTSPVAGNTACETEITTNGGQRALATLSRVTTDVTNDTAQAEVTYAFTGSFAVTEACFLDSLAAGVMLARQTFAAVNVISGDSLLVRYKIDVD